MEGGNVHTQKKEKISERDGWTKRMVKMKKKNPNQDPVWFIIM